MIYILLFTQDGSGMAQPMVEAEHLTRTFRGGVRALDDLSLQVPAGVVNGLLGPNGAGPVGCGRSPNTSRSP
jgi:ABC-2 type transport system ATP-binding protein